MNNREQVCHLKVPKPDSLYPRRRSTAKSFHRYWNPRASEGWMIITFTNSHVWPQEVKTVTATVQFKGKSIRTNLLVLLEISKTKTLLEIDFIEDAGWSWIFRHADGTSLETNIPHTLSQERSNLSSRQRRISQRTQSYLQCCIFLNYSHQYHHSQGPYRRVYHQTR